MPSALILGAGPAGASAAITLARAGWRCTLIEARPFPRVKVCGEFISPAATAILEALIVPAELAAGGARRIDTLVFELGDRRAQWAMPRPAWSLSRAALDTLLVARAASAGAVVEQPASVRSVEYASSSVHARLADGRRLSADIILHADGAGRHDPAGPTPSRPGVLGHKCHLRLPGMERTLRMRSADSGYVGTVGVEDGLATCALVADRRLIAHCRGDADAMLASLWPKYDPAWRLAAGDRGEWLACPVAGSPYLRPGHPRSFRIGNAAGAVEPVGGEGIGLALWAGATLGALLAAPLTTPLGAPFAQTPPDQPALTPESLARLQRRFASSYRARLRWRRPACRAAAEVLMRPRLAAFLWPLLRVPSLSIAPWYALTGKSLSRGLLQS